MAENKNSFILHKDTLSTIEKLSDETAGKLFKHILRYVNNENPTPENDIIDLVFEPIKNKLKEHGPSPLERKAKSFYAPSVEEVREYCFERNNGVDAQNFIDFYESKGWIVGKTKMKSWKAAVRTWEKNSNKQNQNQNGKQEERYAGRQSIETIQSNAEHAQRSAEYYRKQMLGDTD